MIPIIPLLSVAGSAVGKVLRSIPWQAWALAAAVAACWWYGEARADQREAEVRAEYEARITQQGEDAAQFLAEELEANRKREQALSDEIIRNLDQHAKDLRNAEARAALTVAAAKSGELRVRQHWQACLRQLPGPGAASDDPGRADEGADLRAADIGHLQRIGGSCDAEVKWWQTTYSAAVNAVNAQTTGD